MTPNEPFATFFINFEPILNEERENFIRKKLKKTINDLKEQQKKANKEIEENAKKTAEKIAKFAKNLTKKIYSGLTATRNLTMGLSAIASTLGTLSLLKFDSIQELSDNMERIGENSELVYKYLSASNKVIGASQSGVISELDSIAKAIELKKALNINSRPEWMAFGANTSMSMDEILTKFQEKIQSLTKAQGKVFAERMGLSNTYRIAELSNDEFNKLINLSVYNKSSIDKLKESAKATKAVLGELKDTKDTMLIQFSPLVVSVLKSIGDFLNSSEVSMVVSSFSGLASDIGKFNDTLKGIPFKALISALAINGLLSFASSKHGAVMLSLGAGASLFQDLYHGFQQSVLGGTPGKDGVKENISHGFFDNLKFAGRMLNDESSEEDNPFMNSPFVRLSKLDSGNNNVKNGNITNNTSNNSARNSNVTNNTININVNSRDRDVARDVKREVQAVLDNNKNSEYNSSEFK